MKVKLILVLLITLMLLTSCFNSGNEPKKNQPPVDSGSQLVTYGVAGRIKNINKNETGDKIIILVESELENNGSEYDKASVTVTDETIIYGIDGTEANNIELGQYVRVFFAGEVMESYPVQATAKQVNIVPEEALELKDDPSE